MTLRSFMLGVGYQTGMRMSTTGTGCHPEPFGFAQDKLREGTGWNDGSASPNGPMEYLFNFFATLRMTEVLPFLSIGRQC